MTAALRIIAAGPGVTIQDAGRIGHLRFGVTPAGPMDFAAYRTAVHAAGAGGRQGAAIEVSLGGLDLASEGGPLVVAVASGGFRVTLGGTALPPAARLSLVPGAKLAIRPGPTGSWAYVAVGGSLDVPVVLGSRATHTRSQMGGLHGRALQAGDRIAVAEAVPSGRGVEVIDAPWLAEDASGRIDPVRVVLGPQADHFAPDAIAQFLATEWTLSPRSDRMAYQLEGPPVRHGSKGFNIVSDGIALGAIQVPGSGAPIVLMADRQSTGGYPKIATVIRADLGRLAQRRAMGTVRFSAVSVTEAVDAWRRRRMREDQPIALRPLVRTELTSELLLGLNLIDGATAG